MTGDDRSVTMHPDHAALVAVLRNVIVGLIGFLTLVDLFAAQAILPSLAAAYGVSPSAIGLAANASTIGMAAACLGVALLGNRIEPRTGIWASLALLAIPTSLLAIAPDIVTFTALRIVQGVLMASAFTLTMAYLADRCTAEETASALAAYVTGVVASNLVGRLVAAYVTDVLGLQVNFYLFAALNVSGALLVLGNLERMRMMAGASAEPRPALAAWRTHLSQPGLLASFGIGFLILFAFVGTFTYVSFALVAPPLSLPRMSLGLVYLVFLPSMLTTPLAGRAAVRLGVRPAMWAALAVAGLGLPMLLASSLTIVLAGMTLVGAGTFFAQAIATGYVGRTATTDRAAASGLYLASYYLGGLAGAFALGQAFDAAGWEASVAGVGMSIALAALLAARLRPPAS